MARSAPVVTPQTANPRFAVVYAEPPDAYEQTQALTRSIYVVEGDHPTKMLDSGIFVLDPASTA